MSQLCLFIRIYVVKIPLRKKGIYSLSINHPKFPFSIQSEFKNNETFNNNWNNYYKKQLTDKTRPNFFIHDGPPYANGELHVGHALNKMLKDTLIRFKLLSGYRVEFIPGWDCHGLPTELHAIKNASNTSVRITASKFAQKYVQIHKSSFENWGVLGSWDHCYRTMDNEFQAAELAAFRDMHSKGLLYRDLLPVYWSTKLKCALAEYELKYNDHHVSQAVYLKIKVTNISNILDLEAYSNVFCLIWTTTPWTLFSNEAIAYDPNGRYTIVKNKLTKDIYIVGAPFIDQFMSIMCVDKLHVLKEVMGSDLSNCTYQHPIRSECSNQMPFLPSPHVTNSVGTGLVHIAPCHGKEDFLLGKKHNLPTKLMIDDSGCFSADCGPDFKGLSILDTGNDKVLKLIEPMTILRHSFTHSYPYDWRVNAPVIVKTSDQWFIDVSKLADKCLEAYENVTVLPPSRKPSMLPFITDRPNWCISRQRVWGVPIPILTTKSNKTIVDYEFIDHLISRVSCEGSDFWFNESLQDIVPAKFWSKWSLQMDDIVKSDEIFDVWFDSGLSWSNLSNSVHYSQILKPGTVADVYCEGHDQFRGWFSASLLLNVALSGKSPYRSIMVHGFSSDSTGRKMSKSEGNGISPHELLEQQRGCTDVLRYWVAASGLRAVCPVGHKELNQCASSYKLLRNSLRFMLGNLYDFSPEEFLLYSNSPTTSSSKQMTPNEIIINLVNLTQSSNSSLFNTLDYAVLYSLGKLVSDYLDISYPQWQFDTFLSNLNQFISWLSTVYHTSVKDRLYFTKPDNTSRRATQTVFFLTVECFKLLLAPLLPYLAEEIEAIPCFKQCKNFERANNQPATCYQAPITLLERWSSLSLVDGSCLKANSDWLICLEAMKNWLTHAHSLRSVNASSSLMHQIFDSLPSVEGKNPSISTLSRSHIHLHILDESNELRALLESLHPVGSVTSRSTDLCYLLRSASTSWSVGTRLIDVDEMNSVIVSFKFLQADATAYLNIVDESNKCPRCHRYTRSPPATLCSRCERVMTYKQNQDPLVKVSS